MNIYAVPVDDTVFFPVSGDEMRRQTLREENGGHPIRQDQVTANQCQNDLKETEVPTHNSIPYQTHDLPPARHLPWCDRSLCTSHGGPDVEHVGQTVRLERTNADGESFFFQATPQLLEERGYGWTTTRYVSLIVGSEPFGQELLNIDEAEIETVADWFCSLAEKLRATRTA